MQSLFALHVLFSFITGQLDINTTHLFPIHRHICVCSFCETDSLTKKIGNLNFIMPKIVVNVKLML